MASSACVLCRSLVEVEGRAAVTPPQLDLESGNSLRVFTRFSRAEEVLLVHFTQNVTKHNPPPSPTEAAGGVRPSTGGAGRDARTVMWRGLRWGTEERHGGVGGGGDGGGGDGGGDGGGGDGDGSRKRPLQGGAERPGSGGADGERDAEKTASGRRRWRGRRCCRRRRRRRHGRGWAKDEAQTTHGRHASHRTRLAHRPRPLTRATLGRQDSHSPEALCPHALPTCVHGDRPNTLGTWRESWNGDGLRPPALRLR